jgi:hypothetical protein
LNYARSSRIHPHIKCKCTLLLNVDVIGKDKVMLNMREGKFLRKVYGSLLSKGFEKSEATKNWGNYIKPLIW